MIKNLAPKSMNSCEGKFIKKLADLYEIADLKNAKKLESAFSEIFEKYRLLDIAVANSTEDKPCEICNNGTLKHIGYSMKCDNCNHHYSLF